MLISKNSRVAFQFYWLERPCSPATNGKQQQHLHLQLAAIVFVKLAR